MMKHRNTWSRTILGTPSRMTRASSVRVRRDCVSPYLPGFGGVREHLGAGRASVGVMYDVNVPTVGCDAEVVWAWFDEHARSLGSYAARRVGPNLARDVVAETFRIACEQYDQFDPGRGAERAWLFGIATNLIRRHWRTEERRLRIQAQASRIDSTRGDPLLRVDERLDASKHYQRVVDAVAKLDPEDRDLLVLIAWEQMTSREAAAVLGIPAGTVRSRLTRIRTHLAENVPEGDTNG